MLMRNLEKAENYLSAVSTKKAFSNQNLLFLIQDNQAQALDLLKALQNLKIDLDMLTRTR